MPRRKGVETNPYLIPVFDPKTYPSYRAPAKHVAARAMMRVVGDVDIKPEQLLAVLDEERRIDQRRDQQQQQQQQQQQLLLEQREAESGDGEEEDDVQGEAEEGDDFDAERTAVVSPLAKRLRHARHFADHHRRVCTECRYEHTTRLQGEQKKLFDAEYKGRDGIYLMCSAARKELKDEYLVTHIRIYRYLEATRMERDKARRLAMRQEAQRKFDAEELAARNALAQHIFTERTNLCAQGCTATMEFIAMEARIERKDMEKTQRAERHVVNIGSHMRAEKLRRIESNMFTLVGTEPNSRRLVEAEYERGVQRLRNWNSEDIEATENAVLNKELQQHAKARSALEKEEGDARFKLVVSRELRDRDEVHQAKLQDRGRIFLEQLIVKRDLLNVTEAKMRRQLEAQAATQMSGLFLRMVAAVEASARYALRIEAHGATAELCSEFGVDFG